MADAGGRVDASAAEVGEREGGAVRRVDPGPAVGEAGERVAAVPAADPGGGGLGRLGSRPLHPGEQHGVGAGERGGRLAEQAGGQQAGAGERAAGIEEHEVEVTGSTSRRWKPSSRTKQVDGRIRREHRGRAGVAVGIRVNGNARPEQPAELQHLVGLGIRRPAVAAGEHGGAVAGLDQPGHGPRDGGGLAGAAGGEVADGNGRASKRPAAA